MEDISKTIRGIVDKIPRRRNSSEKNNIYLSVLLTFLDMITPETKDKDRFESLVKGESTKINLYNLMYKVPKDYRPILYHTDESLSDYVMVLTREARISIRNDLNDLLYSSVPTSDLYSDVVAQFGGEDNDNGEY